jgi:Tol biopolymer transport system component
MKPMWPTLASVYGNARFFFAVLAVFAFFGSGVPAAPRHRILFSRLAPVHTGIFIANADGSSERALLPADGLDYSAALAASGTWLVFTSERNGSADLFRMNVDGSGLERLTDDPAYDDQAAIAPDGKSVAFVSTRGTGKAHVWVLDIRADTRVRPYAGAGASRVARQLTNGDGGDFRPSWSPDGQWIAFSSDRDSHPGPVPGRWEQLQSTGVYVVRRDGGGLRRLTADGGFAGTPKWSADGTRIIYYETTPLGTWHAQRGDPVQGRTQIVSIDVATGARVEHTSGDGVRLWPQFLADGRIGYVHVDSRGKDLPMTAIASNGAALEIRNRDGRVTTGPGGMVRSPSWSADGRLVAYHKITVAAQPNRWTTVMSKLDDFEMIITEPFPSFSRQGDRLSYSATTDGTNVADTSIAVMRADGSERRQVFARQGVSAFSSSWSPAGDVIAFGVGRYFRIPGHPTAQVAIVNADGSNLRFIADDASNNGFPSWSPDGTRIVYKQDAHLVIYSVADGKVTNLTQPGPQYDNFPSWSSKDVITFTSNRDGDFDIYTIKPDGTNLRRLTKSPGVDGHSIWSPDGEWIMFSSARMGFKDERPLLERIPQPYGELFVMRADGTGLRQLTDNQWEDATPAWMPEQRASNTSRSR